MRGVTFIISARNEYPQIAMTIDNLMLDCHQSGIPFEVIIADNASTDNTSKFYKYAWNNPYAKQADHQLKYELKKGLRGLAHTGRVRFVYDPVFSNVGARHLAVQYAKYPNIIFADAHISVKPGTTKVTLETLEKFGGVVHCPVAWMGADVSEPSAGMQYSYKIGEKIWGTWNRAQVSAIAPFYIPLSGHCWIAVNKKEYEAMGGYDTHQRVYGGGENYLDTLYWMLGSTVMVDPRGLVLHLSAGRGYSYDTRSLTHNMILTAYTLGGEKWAERILITYLDKAGVHNGPLMELYNKTLEEGKEKREWIKANAKYTLEEVLGIGKPNDCEGKEYKMQAHPMRPWDKLNQELYGKHISFVQVFEDWLDRLETKEAKEFFANSPYQK